MKNLNPINRALVATLLVLAGLFGVRLAQQALREPPGFEVRVAPDAVHAISVTTAERVLRLERSGDAWNLALPAGAVASADRAAVTRFLSSWRDFQTSYLVSPRVSGGPSFESSTVMRLHGPGGAELVAVEVGERLVSGERALRRVGHPRVYAGSIAAADLLVTDPGRWVDRPALVLSAELVVRFGLTNEHGAQVFDRVDGRWTREGGPVRDRGVARMVLSAIELGLATQLDAESAPTDDDTAREPRITVWWEEQDGVRRVAHLCGDVPGGERVYLDRETDALFSVPRDELMRFGAEPADLAAVAPGSPRTSAP